jgi:hypothetical protein
MTVFIVDDDKRAEIAAAIARARANVVPWITLRAMLPDWNQETGTLMLADRKPGTELRPSAIPVHFVGGITAAISFEEQPAGLIRHLSVGSGKHGKVIDPILFAAVAEEFGFRELPTGNGRVWIEEYAPNKFAINVAVIEQPRADHPTKQ